MKIQHTPAPYPSTILSLEPAEFFPGPGFQVQAITVSSAETVFSGPDPHNSLLTHTVPASTPEEALRTVPFSPAQDQLRPALREALRAHTPAPSPSPAPSPAHTQHTHLAAPGPAPTQAQADSIRNSAGPRSLPPQPQHLAAPAPGAHRAGR